MLLYYPVDDIANCLSINNECVHCPPPPAPSSNGQWTLSKRGHLQLDESSSSQLAYSHQAQAKRKEMIIFSYFSFSFSISKYTKGAKVNFQRKNIIRSLLRAQVEKEKRETQIIIIREVSFDGERERDNRFWQQMRPLCLCLLMDSFHVKTTHTHTTTPACWPGVRGSHTIGSLPTRLPEHGCSLPRSFGR